MLFLQLRRADNVEGIAGDNSVFNGRCGAGGTGMVTAGKNSPSLMEAKLRFRVPRERLQWARTAIEDFHRESQKFIETWPGHRVVHKDLEARRETIKFVFEGEIPWKIQSYANRVIEDLKNVFDQATFAACRAIDDKVTDKDTRNFPWAQSEKDLNGKLYGKHNKIPNKLFAAFFELKPYSLPEEGFSFDYIVRELAQLANRKHSIGLVMQCNVASIMLPSFFGCDEIDWASGIPLDFENPEWDVGRKELKIATGPLGTSACLKNDTQFSFYIAIDVTGPIGQVPFIHLAAAFAEKAETVITTLEREVYAVIQELDDRL